MAYWCVARLQPRKEVLALRCLTLNGYETYLPRLRVQRVSRGRHLEFQPALFPGYLFLVIHSQWYSARWAPGVGDLIMDGTMPAKLSNAVISEIKAREVRGLIELRNASLRRGDRVKILRGPFAGHLAIYANMRPQERVEVLLALLGSQQRVTMPKADVEAM
jgi:transcriptional antiterminator RfaH